MTEELELSAQKSKRQDEEYIRKDKYVEKMIKIAISLVGNNKLYQKILLIYFCFIFVEITFLLVGPSLFFMNPVFVCNGDVKLSENQACKILDQCRLENDFTITAYAELYCDKKNDRTLIQSMIGFGTIAGLLVNNVISDAKGRKFSFMLSLCASTLATFFILIGAYSKSSFVLILSQILSGFGCNCLMILPYVIMDKFMADKMRKMAMMLLNGVWGLTQMSFYFFSSTFLNPWPILLICGILIPLTGIFALSFIVIIEDPIFYFNKKQIKKCKQSLELIAMYNDTEGQLPIAFAKIQQSVSLISNSEIQLNSQGSEKKKKNSLLTVLKNKTILKWILGIGLLGLGGNTHYYALEFSIEQTGGSYGSNIALLGLAEVIGSFSMMLFISKTKRKVGIFFCYSTMVVIGLTYFFDFVKNSILSQSIIIFLVRFIATYSYGFYACFQVESFPTAVQSTAIGLVEVLSQMGKFIAPFLVSISESLGVAPLIVMSFFMLLTMSMLTFVKETYVSENSSSSKQIQDPLTQQIEPDTRMSIN